MSNLGTIEFGSVFKNEKNGDRIVVYKNGKLWIAESNTLNMARDTKRQTISLVKRLGFTKYTGRTEL